MAMHGMTDARSTQRLKAIHRHLAAAADAPQLDRPSPALKSFAADPAWAGKPFWLLQCFRTRAGGAAGAQSFAAGLGALGRTILQSYCRTVVGRSEFDRVIITEFDSPIAYAESVVPSAAFRELVPLRAAAFEHAYEMPIRAGWFRLSRPAPQPRLPIRRFTPAEASATRSGLVGEAARGARAGHTSSTSDQAEAFAGDDRLGSGVLWHLNLLRFREGGEGEYRQYQRAMGRKDGVLGLFGARSTLANECWRALSGGAAEFDAQQAIIAEYPSRDAYFSMSASEPYLRGAHHRHLALESTYIISLVAPPELLRESETR